MSKNTEQKQQSETEITQEPQGTFSFFNFLGSDTPQVDYDPNILTSFEYFLSRESTQNRLINNLIKDYEPDDQGKVNGLSFGTAISLAGSFLKAPGHTANLLKFYSNQEKYNTQQFKEALIKSDATWGFVDRTADKLERIVPLMKNMGVDLFDDGKPLDQEGIVHIKDSLKDTKFINSLKEIAISSQQSDPQQSDSNDPKYMELSSKFLGAISETSSAVTFLQSKGQSIQDYVASSLESQIEYERQLTKEWNEITEARGNDPEQLRIFREDFLNDKGITGETAEKALKDGKLPQTIEQQLEGYGLNPQDLNKILDIIPVLLDSPGELKKMTDALADGKYFDIARQVIDLADDKPQIKEYLKDNKEIFGKVVKAMIAENLSKDASIGGEIYDIVPALFDNTKALKEIIDLSDQGDYNKVSTKVFDLITEDTNVRSYFQQNQESLENLITETINSHINSNRKALQKENLAWQELDKEAKKKYLNTEDKWKKYSDLDKKRMINNNRLQDFGDMLSNMGIDQQDIATISHMAVSALNSPENTKAVLGNISNMVNFAEGSVLQEGMALDNLTDMAKNALTLIAESPDMTESLNEQKALIGKIVQANMVGMPGIENINPSDLVPFLVNHPDELKQIIDLVKEEKYNDIAPIILDLAKEDRSLANYLEENKTMLPEAALTYTGYDKYDLSPEIMDIFVNLTTETNLDKLKDIAALAEKGEWVKVGANFADLMDKDPAFKQSIQDNKENINKIIDVIMTENPDLRRSLGGVEVGSFVNNILSDPGGVRDLLNSYDSGSTTSLAMQGVKFATNKLLDTEFRGAVATSAGNIVAGTVTQEQQTVVETVTQVLSARRNYSEKVKLSDTVQGAFEQIAKSKRSETEGQKFLKETNSNTVFDGTTIRGTSINQVRLDSLDISGMQFVNTTFENVSFANSNISKTSFSGANFSNVIFTGATMDAEAFGSLLPEIQRGAISLQGVKVEGALDNMDLQNISFHGADLSGVTSMKGTNVNHTNFTSTAMPADEIVAQTFNLQNADFFISEQKREQLNTMNQEKIGEEITNQLVTKAKSEGIEMSKEQVSALQQEVVRLYGDKSEIGQQLQETVNTNHQQLMSGEFLEDSNSISHVSEYKGKLSHRLTLIYDNIQAPERIESALTADLVADQVTRGLFADGHNRGKDGLEIQKALENSVHHFTKETSVAAREMLSHHKRNEVVDEITDSIRSKTKYTNVGIASGGIYLPEGAISEDMNKQFATKMGAAFGGENAMSSKERELIADMSAQIASNIFGAEAKSTHPSDVAKINGMLEVAFYKLKQDNPSINIEAAITENKEQLVGNLDRGYIRTTGTGLTKEFYDNATYTGTSLANNVKSDNVKEAIDKAIKNIILEDKAVEKTNQPPSKENQSKNTTISTGEHRQQSDDSKSTDKAKTAKEAIKIASEMTSKSNEKSENNKAKSEEKSTVKPKEKTEKKQSRLR